MCRSWPSILIDGLKVDAQMGILKRLFGADESDADGARQQRIDETIERIMRLHPHLRLARQVEKRLAPAVSTALTYVTDLVETVPPPREASGAAWSDDPYIHAYFAAADDVAQLISRSADLQAYFAQHPDMPEVIAVLGMEMTERHVLGVGLEGDALRRDVAQTTVSFNDHQVRMCGRSDAELKDEIVRRALDQFGLEAMARIGADSSRRDVLERERALLKTRLMLLERQGAGISAVVGGDAAAESGELARLQAQMDENELALADLGLPHEAIDSALEHVCDVFAQPAQHMSLSTRRLRLDRMNVVQEGSAAEAHDQLPELQIPIARIPTTPPRTRAFSLIRFARKDLLPAQSMFDQAARLLNSGLLS
jgi:hypothetical protein